MSLFRGGWRPLAAWTFGGAALALVVAVALAPVFGYPAPDVVGALSALVAAVTMYISRGMEKIFGAEKAPPEAPPRPVPHPPAAGAPVPVDDSHRAVVPAPETPPPASPPVAADPRSEPITPSGREMLDRDERMAGLDPAFAQRLMAVLQQCAAEGLPFRVFEARRSAGRQAALYAQGRTVPGPRVTAAKPGQSLHQYGVAADVVLFENGRWSWDASGENAARWTRLHEIARAHGLEPLSWELPHLQLVGARWQDYA